MTRPDLLTRAVQSVATLQRMKIPVQSYLEQRAIWPREGRHILAQFDDDWVIVYQAYRPGIGHFAAREGYFGGEFSLNRMSWVQAEFSVDDVS